MTPNSQHSTFQRTVSPSLSGVTEEMQTRLTENCKVRILFEGSVTREAITKLTEFLDVGKDAYPAQTKANNEDSKEV